MAKVIVLFNDGAEEKEISNNGQLVDFMIWYKEQVQTRDKTWTR